MAETTTEHQHQHDHQHGHMDVSAQERTYNGFIKVTAIFFAHVFIILILLAIFRT